MSASVTSRGVCQPSPKGIGDARDGLPRIAVGLERAAAFPRPLRRGLAAGMGELDAELGAARRRRRRITRASAASLSSL